MPKQYANIEITEETTVSSKALADITGLSQRRIEQLAHSGLMVKSGEGRYQLKASLKNYILDQQKELDQKKETQINDYKLRQEKAKAEKLEIELAEIKDELIDKETVLSVFSEAMIIVKTKMLAIPSKIAQLVRVAKTDLEAKQIIEKHIKIALTETANLKLEHANEETETEQTVSQNGNQTG